MYVTRPISTYRNFPSILSTQPPETLYAGYLVVTDDEITVNYRSFCGIAWRKRRIDNLPFPQDKIFVIRNKISLDDTISYLVWFVPVLDQPLSSNRYYIIVAEGKFKGQAYTSSREEDITNTCCGRQDINKRNPKPFDYRDIYQQFEIHKAKRKGRFYAKSLAEDGLPLFLTRQGWEVFDYESCQSPPVEAQGLNASLHTYLPKFKFPISVKRSTPVVVGKWCCPFVFVKEETTVEKQMKDHLLYNMTLEQWWEEIYSCENEISFKDSKFTLNKSIQRQLARVHGMDAVKDNEASNDGFVWFWVRNQRGKRGTSVGLSLAMFEKMRKMEEGRGWVDGQESIARVERVEKIESNGWKRFGCYVLVESFVLKRMDGTLVLNCDFRHSHRMESKGE